MLAKVAKSSKVVKSQLHWLLTSIWLLSKAIGEQSPELCTHYNLCWWWVVVRGFIERTLTYKQICLETCPSWRQRNCWLLPNSCQELCMYVIYHRSSLTYIKTAPSWKPGSWRQWDCWPKPRGEQAPRALQLLSLTCSVVCCIAIVLLLYSYCIGISYMCSMLCCIARTLLAFTLCTLTLTCSVPYRMDPLTHVNCKLCTCFLSLIYCTKTWTWKRTIWSTLTTKIKFSN